MARKRKSVKSGASKPRSLPSKSEILEFIKSSTEKVGKREIARAFGIRGDARRNLKDLLAEMSEDGTLTGSRKGGVRKRGTLPAVAVLEVTGRDSQGDLIAKPTVWNTDEGDRPSVLILLGRSRGPSADIQTDIGMGDQVLARINELSAPDIEGFRFEASPIKRLPRDKQRLLGIFRGHRNGGGTIEPIDRKMLRSWSIKKGDQGEAKDGDLVCFDLTRSGRAHIPQARILESIGNPDDQRQTSLIAIHTHGLRDDFPESVLAEVKDLAPLKLKERTDLRDLPLVTIDPPDARDHDDAVYAEADGDPKNKDGWVVIVAIADVAHYVRSGTKLDREAQIRGNSVYFPDRVVPMLPERISNDLCSLREGEDRPCLAVRMVVDGRGNKRSHTFLRGMMRSEAKLSYQEVQAAFDGKPSQKCKPLMEPVLKPLQAVYAALAEARDRREPLDLDLPERKIVLDSRGQVERVFVPERLTAHRLIEEFMIQANVAAAETLERKGAPVVYRIHDQPSKEKLKSLRDFLNSLDMKLAPPGNLKPAHFNRILARAKTMPVPDLINEVVLRSQSQAEYNPENIGHFGLNLSRYVHFTSPIRRYADLIGHRALVRALRLGAGGLEDGEAARLAEVSKQISDAERRAMAAERATVDRLIAAHLADRIGATFTGRIAGVTRSGLFVRLKECGADGFVPVSSLVGDFYRHIEAVHALVGQRSGTTFSLGDPVEVRLVEAIPSAGALRFEMLSDGKKGKPSSARGHQERAPKFRHRSRKRR